MEKWDLVDASVDCTPTACHEDMPWSLDGTSMLVSDRLRTFFEHEIPGDAQYLPVQMVGPGAKGLSQEYWVVNWLRSFECLDKARSYNECDLDDDDSESPFVEIPVIDPAKIPSDGVVGRIAEYSVVVLARDDLKNKLKDAGLRGPQFFRIFHSSDKGAPAPIWQPGVRRR